MSKVEKPKKPVEQEATKPTKERAANYEAKVAFNGTFEDMIGISIKDAEKKVKAKQAAKKD